MIRDRVGRFLPERRLTMPDTNTKNMVTSAEEAAKITPRAEFRVFGHGVIDIVKQKMWEAKAVLEKARKMPMSREDFLVPSG